MRNAFAAAVVLLASSGLPAQAEVQSFFLHFGDPPVSVAGGSTSHFIDASAPTNEDPVVFEQTTPKEETTVFPTFTSTPFAAGTTLKPVASVRMYLAANQKMRSCAGAAATVFRVASNGAATVIGTGTRTEATVEQGSAGGVVGARLLRIEFPLTDTTLAAGESFAIAPSFTNACSINRRTFFAYDGDDDPSGVRFQCCLTTAAKCAGAKMKDAAVVAYRMLHRVGWNAALGRPYDPEELASHGAALTKAFAKRDARGTCPTTGDAPAILALLDGFVASMRGTLDPLGPAHRNRCQGKKLQGLAARVKKGLDLEAKAAQRAEFLDVDLGKLAKLQAGLVKAFTTSEAKGGCDTTGDLAAIETAAHTFITTVSARLACPCP